MSTVGRGRSFPALTLVLAVALAGVAALLFLAAPSEAVAFPGPDLFGYRGKDDTSPGGPAWTPFDITAGGADTVVPGTCPAGCDWPGGLNDDEYSSSCVPIGFTFNFYGTDYTCVWVNDNGFVSFSAPGATTPAEMRTPVAIPATTNPDNIVAGYWVDMIPPCSDGGAINKISYLTSGAAPNQVFTVQWTEVWLNGQKAGGVCAGVISFQVQLYQTTNCAMSQLANVFPKGLLSADINSVAIGIEDASGGDGLQYSFGSDDAAMTFTNKPIEFCPNNLPVASDDSVEILEDVPSVTISPLDNDSDADGDTLALTSVSGGAKGSFVMSGNDIVYTPDPDQYGVDLLTYVVVDGVTPVSSDTGSLLVTINPVNDAPSFTPWPPGKVSIVGEDTGPKTVSAWAVGIHKGGASYLDGQPPDVPQTVSFTVLAADPSLFSAGPALSGLGVLTYTPAPDRCDDVGTIVTATPKDNGGTLDGGVDTGTPSTFLIRVLCINDPPLADPVTVTTPLGVAVPFTLVASDVEDGAALTYTLMGAPSFGSLAGTAPSLSFDPESGCGVTTVQYRVTDSAGASSPPVTITLQTPCPWANTPPVAQPQSWALPMGGQTSMILLAIDPDTNQTLTYGILAAPLHGTLTGAPPLMLYQADAGFEGQDAFTFAADDGLATGPAATVSFFVSGQIPGSRDSPGSFDSDQDGFLDPQDNCPGNGNHGQEDGDLDGLGDACDPLEATGPLTVAAPPPPQSSRTPVDGDALDSDRDGVADGSDNCVVVVNDDQADADLDGRGDSCDSDRDGDNWPNTLDNCPVVHNGSQNDKDGDAVGDACDLDFRAASAGDLLAGSATGSSGCVGACVQDTDSTAADAEPASKAVGDNVWLTITLAVAASCGAGVWLAIRRLNGGPRAEPPVEGDDEDLN